MNSVLKFERLASLVALRPGGRPQVARPSIFAVLFCHLFWICSLLIALSIQSVKAEIRDVVYAGLDDGTVHLCKPLPLSELAKKAGQEQCERLNSLGYKITAMAFGDNVLYVGTDEGKIWTCNPHIKDQCQYMNHLGSPVTSLVYNDNSLWAGTSKGIMLLCDPVKLDACTYLNDLGTGRSINAMVVEGDALWAGTRSGQLWRCENRNVDTCVKYSVASKGDIHAIKIVGNSLYAANNIIMKCKKANASTPCKAFYQPGKVDEENGYYFPGIERVNGKIVAGYSYFKRVQECFAIGGCRYHNYWGVSKIASCPPDDNPVTKCKAVMVGHDKGQLSNFQQGKAHGLNLYYSSDTRVWFSPFTSNTKSEWDFNSNVSRLLYVER